MPNDTVITDKYGRKISLTSDEAADTYNAEGITVHVDQGTPLERVLDIFSGCRPSSSIEEE